MERAIRYELDRMGQVFYVVPRIQGIKDVQALLKSSFPDVGIAIAHGKQSAKELDKTMEEFTEGGIQILLCTSIIENGLDVATVNTIIIEDAHLLGLAQIYQLRGRVGRSGQEAHAYLFHPRKEFLTTEASRRLAAIEECCELGQGFQLAERDMGIRGIGNVFGERQSGDLKKIGVDLYAEMLFDALSKVDYHSIPQLEFKDVQLQVDINAYAYSIPETEKLIGGALQSAEESIYALMSFTTNAAKQLVPIEMLLKTIFIKRMAADLGIYRVVATNRSIIMETYLDDQALKLLCDAMDSETVAISIILRDSCIQLQSVLELTVEQQFDYIFYFLSEMRKSLPSFIKHKAITYP